MLSQAERQFMDLYLREGFTHDYEGHAHRASRERGISYDHFVELYPYYQEAWKFVGEWADHLPPVPEDSRLPCPWDSKDQLETRLRELKTLVASRTMLAGW
jgi:hypothetical protein